MIIGALPLSFGHMHERQEAYALSRPRLYETGIVAMIIDIMDNCEERAQGLSVNNIMRQVFLDLAFLFCWRISIGTFYPVGIQKREHNYLSGEIGKHFVLS